MRNFFTTLALTAGIPFLAFAQDGGTTTYEETTYEEPIKTPEEIQRELEQDEILFKQALEMFNPWYAGPLLTGGAHMMPPGRALSSRMFLSQILMLYGTRNAKLSIFTTVGV